MTDPSKKLGKLEITDSAPSEDESGTAEAIFKVRDPDYVPHGVELRARIDSTLFTGTVPSCEVERVQSDPKVESVEVTKRLRIID